MHKMANLKIVDSFPGMRIDGIELSAVIERIRIDESGKIDFQFFHIICLWAHVRLVDGL